MVNLNTGRHALDQMNAGGVIGVCLSFVPLAEPNPIFGAMQRLPGIDLADQKGGLGLRLSGATAQAGAKTDFYSQFHRPRLF